MACQKAQQTHDCGDHSGCHHADQYCGCINVATSAAESATSSALAAAESALLAQRVVQNCLTDSTIKPGGGLAYEDGKGIIVDFPALAANLAGKGLAASGGKLAFDPAAVAGHGLAAQGSALIVDGASLAGLGLSYQGGRFAIDFSRIDGEARRQILSAIVAPGGGFAFDSEGKLCFDASKMDTTGIEALMKAIKQPVWLAANTTVYVDASHAQASDALDEGRGLASGKPFKTIQAAVGYIADNFNLGSFHAYVDVAAGDYPEFVSVPDIATGGGSVTIRGAGAGTTVTGFNFGTPTCNAYIQDLKIKYRGESRPGSATYAGLTYMGSSSLGLSGVVFDGGEGAAHNKRAISVGNGFVTIRENCSFTGDYYSCLECSGGTISIYKDCSVSDLSVSMAFAFANGSGLINNSASANGGTLPRVIGSASGNGTRYRITGFGQINTNGGGPDYFPGAKDGVIVSSSQYA